MLRLSEAARAVQGDHKGNDAMFTSVSTDSRTLETGALFVALEGPRFNGHDFVRQAADNGAAAAMVRTLPVAAQALTALPMLFVADTRMGLGRLASHWRGKFSMPLIALTGSNGKTTVKEMLARILAQSTHADEQVLATRGNLNNDIGVPLTLLRLAKRHRFAVIEMGTNHAGEIFYLTGLARPDVALITNAGRAHVEGIGSVEAVARAKGEIFAGLSATGVAVINADDPFAPLWRGQAAGRKRIEFGLERRADVSASFELQARASDIILNTPLGNIAARLNVPGAHNVRNALAAAAAALALGVPLDAIAAGLARFSGVAGRLQAKAGPQGATFLDDTYNANPESLRAAIAVLAATPGVKILVLGDMGELGPEGLEWHGEAGRAAKQSGVDQLLALGESARAAAAEFGAGARHYPRIEDLLADLKPMLAPGVTVLVKGSRFMQMERVFMSLEAADEARPQ